ncbi:hypothetical protein [Gordonia sp. 852002-51296_SCH5728562-b]|uniref:hypothetical protein n=1 Tax=Gordonia sp. 852002-51296_SCH5728562-b TaxID=1834101 RepID=UPI000B033B67|nr:hypothetical protein [Gordonia sp. 852002-51296_SCH5728562-b]
MTDTDDDNRPTLRFNVTVSPVDRRRLKKAAADVDTPMAVLARTLINYGIDHLDDPEIKAVVDAAAEAEHVRRVDAASKGGKVGGGSNKKKE